MKTANLIPAAPLDRRELAPGVQLCFTRLDAPLCPPPLDWPRLLVFDFCRSGRRAIPAGAQYAIVTEGHAAVSFAVPGADFYPQKLILPVFYHTFDICANPARTGKMRTKIRPGC